MAITNSAKANELKRKIARLQEVEFDRSGPFIYTSFDPFEREKCKERDKFYADKQKRVEVLEAELNELKGKIAERQSVHR